MSNKRIVIIILIFAIIKPVYLFSENENRKDPTFKKAVKYFFQKKIEMAEILFQEVIKKNPENSLAYSYLGDIFLKKKKYNGALSLYRKAIDINPEIAENYFRIGQAYYYKKSGDDSIENFKKAVEIDKNLKFSYFHIGLSYLMLKRDKHSTIDNWETYLKLAPEDPQYEKIRRVIQLLRDPDFVIPPHGSDITIEEALLLGGKTLKDMKKSARDKKAGHEKKKTKNKFEGLYLDDDL